MNFYQFMSDSPWLTFFLAIIAMEAFCYPLKIVNRWIRHRNIVVRGWPRAHRDGDGDWQKDESR